MKFFKNYKNLLTLQSTCCNKTRVIKQSQQIRQFLHQKLGRIFSTATVVMLLTLLSGLRSVQLSLAQTPTSNPQSELIKEIKALAHSDAENDIPRRTNFIIELYKNNSASLNSPAIRTIYDDTYTEQIKHQNESRRNIWIGIITMIVLLGLPLIIFAIKKKTLLMPRFDPAKFKKVSVSLPFGIGSAEWEADSTERRAAWSLYVELVTRIAVQPLEVDQGLLREALTSLYNLFGVTRQVLKEAGPDVGASHDSVGGIAIAVLNNGLRPFLAKWHPLLQTWEARPHPDISLKEHEQNWTEEPTLREELEKLRSDLKQYANALAEIVGVEQ